MNKNNIVNIISSKIRRLPHIGIILGSGLGNFSDFINDKIIITYDSIPDYPISTVPGHA